MPNHRPSRSRAPSRPCLSLPHAALLPPSRRRSVRGSTGINAGAAAGAVVTIAVLGAGAGTVAAGALVGCAPTSSATCSGPAAP